MPQGIKYTDFKFLGQSNKYVGKVRDVYSIGDKIIVISSDRISAFDTVLPKPIPHKGRVLNEIAATMFEKTEDIVPNWVLETPDPNVTIGKKCDPFHIEMVIRGYLAGHAWREYRDGKHLLCDVALPEGLKENDKLPLPIITPTTKSHKGHDEDISKDKILKEKLVGEEDYVKLEQYTRQLFERGTELAAKQGLILVDTKYEFGKSNGEIVLIDEVHTPDSSRYFYADGYERRQAKARQQKQLSKEFVRQWLISNGFNGKEGQRIPEMDEEFVQSVSERYIELFKKITGKEFVMNTSNNILDKIKTNIDNALKKSKFLIDGQGQNR